MVDLDLAYTNCYYNLLKIKSVNERYISSLPKAAQAEARITFINNLSSNYSDILNNVVGHFYYIFSCYKNNTIPSLP